MTLDLFFMSFFVFVLLITLFCIFLGYIKNKKLKKCYPLEIPEEINISKSDPLYVRIKESIDNFRILSDWDIDYCAISKYKGQCCGIAELKKATIYAWEPEKEEPRDYITHEIIHLAIKALRFSYEHEEYEIAREKEEELVQDICKLTFNK